MPRFITKRKGRLKTDVRAERAQFQRRRKGQWVDPFPHVTGTIPEKIVYSELSRRGIPFLFRNELKFVIPEINFNKYFEADIAIPSLKIIIEVQGSYWHSMDEAIESDAFKFAIYQSTGWRPIAWWDYDIISRVHQLFAADPVLSRYQPQDKNSASTELKPVRQNTHSNVKGIQTMNRNRARAVAYKKPAARVRIRK